MVERSQAFGAGSIETFILRSLVRTLVAKQLLTADDVKGLLFEVATRLDIVGGRQSPQAARAMVDEDMAPFFLNEDPAGSEGST